MLIGELARAADTTKDAIRHYDELGLLEASTRCAGSRYYGEYAAENVERIRMIRLGQTMGFSLREIAELLEAYYSGEIGTEQQIAIFSEKLAAIDEKLAALQETRRYLVAKLALLKGDSG